MAGAQVPLSGSEGVHIPFCGNPTCQAFLQHVEGALQQGGIPCVKEYEPGGLYKQRFQQAFRQTSCTILHVCPEILRQMSGVESVLRNDPGKAWFVRLDSGSSSDADSPLLLEFHIKDLSTQEKRSRFVDDLLVRFGGSDSGGHHPVPGTETSDTQAADASQQPPSSPEGVEGGEEPGDFCHVPMVLRPERPARPWVNTSFFSLDSAQCAVQSFNIETEMPTPMKIPPKDHAYIAHVVLPDLQGRGDLISLTKFACSPYHRFRFQALHVMFRLLTEKPSEFSRETLKSVEEALFTSLEQHLKHQLATPQEKDAATQHVDIAEFLAIVYLLVVAVCISRAGQAHENAALCQCILSRPLLQMKKSGSVAKLLKQRLGITGASAPFPAWYLAMKECLATWASQQARERVRKAADSLMHSTTQQSTWSRVSSWGWPMKLSLFVECLLESFKTSRPVLLDFLKSFLKTVKEPSRTQIQRPITSFFILGVSFFLQSKLEALSSLEDFQALCTEIMDSLNAIISRLDEGGRHVCIFLMTPLVFSMNKIVRQRTGVLMRQQSFYHERMWDMLLRETCHLFWPLLHIPPLQPDSKSTIHQSWVVVASEFHGHRVLTHIHRPTGTEHLKHNRTESVRLLQQDCYFRELGLLREMKHENVLRLVAYHKSSCPQVYVTEDYRTEALQAKLVTLSRNSQHFPLGRLLSILLEVLKGVQYCHEKGIVHRDLTAANVFMTSSPDEKVKLAGFKHALKLLGKPLIMDFDLSFVARRWSAPESHKLCKFSLATDIWMVGHLLYEVVTHGRLPYSHLRMSDEELMRLVVDGKNRLCNERCIPKEVQDLIMDLTVERESQRNVPVQRVVSRLQQIIASKGWSESLCRFFPDLQLGDQAATKHAKGPILDLMDDLPYVGLPSEEQDGGGLYYRNVGHKKGTMQFEKPCPMSFSTEEWNILCQENLPSITKLVGRPQDKDGSGQRVLRFMIATSSYLCSLENAVKCLWLGTDPSPYLLCLQHLAASIAHLHSRGIILRDFSPDTIYIESASTDNRSFKVWVTSLPQIKVLPEGKELERHIDLCPPHDQQERNRAAPEVLQHGQYSPASDVYCFGMLVWWVFNAFDVIFHPAVDGPGDFSPLSAPPLGEVYENIDFHDQPIPRSCPEHLSQLMKECWNPRRHLRPRMNTVRQCLTLDRSQISRANQDLEGYEPIMVANASVGDSLSTSRRTSLSSEFSHDIGNPSELTDTESQFEASSIFGHDIDDPYKLTDTESQFEASSLSGHDIDDLFELTDTVYESCIDDYDDIQLPPVGALGGKEPAAALGEDLVTSTNESPHGGKESVSQNKTQTENPYNHLGACTMYHSAPVHREDCAVSAGIGPEGKNRVTEEEQAGHHEQDDPGPAPPPPQHPYQHALAACGGTAALSDSSSLYYEDLPSLTDKSPGEGEKGPHFYINAEAARKETAKNNRVKDMEQVEHHEQDDSDYHPALPPRPARKDDSDYHPALPPRPARKDDSDYHPALPPCPARKDESDYHPALPPRPAKKDARASLDSLSSDDHVYEELPALTNKSLAEGGRVPPSVLLSVDQQQKRTDKAESDQCCPPPLPPNHPVLGRWAVPSLLPPLSAGNKQKHASETRRPPTPPPKPSNRWQSPVDVRRTPPLLPADQDRTIPAALPTVVSGLIEKQDTLQPAAGITRDSGHREGQGIPRPAEDKTGVSGHREVQSTSVTADATTGVSGHREVQSTSASGNGTLESVADGIRRKTEDGGED